MRTRYTVAMSKWAFAAFAVLMWILPALVAGALDWPGIWGGGSAFSDLIVPAPITGGIVHVPSFIIALALVKAYPTFTQQSAAVARAVLMSALVVGLLQLVDLERLVEAMTTDVSGRAFRLQHSYVGLCMTSDAIVALSWIMRRPLEKQGWLMTSLVILVPAATYIGSDAAGLNRLKEPFQFGRPGFTETRGDGILWIYTRLPTDDPAFREQAGRYVEQHRPGDDINYDDVAVHFTDSLDAARDHRNTTALATLCLYEDGTPDRWHDGNADCFSDHVSFTEGLDARLAELSGSLPTDVAMYLLFVEFCTDLQVPDGYRGGNSHLDFCYRKDLDQKRAELVRAYGEEALASMLGTLD